MDSTVMRYDQQHKVGAQTKKKLLGQGGFTHLRERDNTKECVRLVPKIMRHIHMQFETPARTNSFLYQIPSGQPSENRDSYESISMP
jgi:hypothetical protein